MYAAPALRWLDGGRLTPCPTLVHAYSNQGKAFKMPDTWLALIPVQDEAQQNRGLLSSAFRMPQARSDSTQTGPHSIFPDIGTRHHAISDRDDGAPGNGP